jgi:hypothetical protein
VGDLMRMFAFAIIENFGYRQMTVWFRLKAFWKFLRREHGWGKMEREGFTARPAVGLDSEVETSHAGVPASHLRSGTDR